MGLEVEGGFFLQLLFRVVNFLVYRVRSSAATTTPTWLPFDTEWEHLDLAHQAI